MSTPMRRSLRLLLAGLLVAVTSVTPAFGADFGRNGGQDWFQQDTRVCSTSAPDSADCQAIRGQRYERSTGKPMAATASSGFTASQIRSAYGITDSGNASTVIAIVDAYHATTATADLAAYRSAMGLPALATCSSVSTSGSTKTLVPATSGAPCFAQVNQSGVMGSYPVVNSGWAQEIDLDIQMASAVCPSCSILLVEASSATYSNLNAAVTTAASFTGVRAISNSYGGGDISDGSYPAYKTAAGKGIAVTASTGDSGYGVSFPATSSGVVSVGGTSLTLDLAGNRANETVWSGAGSGCSVYNAAATWVSTTACGSKKPTADVSAVANPFTGVSVYYAGSWYVFGGTSVSSPIVGSWLALNNARWGVGTTFNGNAAQFVWQGGQAWYDVTSGSNGTCTTTVLCTAGVGWDGPTGLGSLPDASSAPQAPAATITGFTPGSGTVGTAVTITGTNFTGATSVQFNGTPSVFTVDGAGTTISATVPSGATSGLITVTTPGGTAASTSSFTVTKIATAFSALGPISATRSTTMTLTATLTAGATPIAGATVTFTFNGKTYTATTNASGVATYSLKAPRYVGNYPANATYAGDATYATTSSSWTVKVS